MAITKENQVQINNYKYNLTSPLLETYLSPLPGKVNIGSDTYSKENYLSQWIQKDRRGGILINEMDESVHSNRVWWSNLIISHDGHLTLPRKATAITSPVSTAGLTVTDPGFEAWTGSTLDSYTLSAGSMSKEDGAPLAGLYSPILYGVATLYQDISATNYAGRRFTLTALCKTAVASNAKIRIWDGKTWSESDFHTGGGGNETLTITKVFAYNADAFRIQFQQYVTTNQARFDTVTLTGPGTVGTISNFANFNGEKYAAFGNLLAKLASGRASYTVIYDFGAAITAIIPSLNSRLYVFLGNSTNYYYMSTAEAFTQSNSSAAYYAVENAGLLYKMNSTGTFASSADPDGATPTWNNLADITTDTSKIEGLFRGRDSDGNYVVYCAMNTSLMVYDATNDKWLPTELRLPDHPNGGKGATYWNDGHYLSYGLGVKKYTVGSTASVSEVGLERDGGLPIEYNGEIVKFGNDSQYFLAALVDASQTSGSSQSGLYVWTGMAWECWWVGPRLLAEDCEDAWTAGASVTATKDTTDFLFGTGSAKLEVALGAAAGGLLATETITSTDFSAYDTMSLWIKSTVALTAGDLQFLMDNDAACASPIELINIPAVAANTWTRVDCTLASASSDTAIVSLGIKMVVDKDAFTLNIERIEAVDYNAAMHDVIVSSAESGYAIYWDCGGAVYYIDLPRGIQNPKQLTGTQTYEVDGILISPWFDAGTAAFPNLVQAITSYARSITTTETVAIRYRTNHENEDRDTGWTTLVVLNSTAENGAVETLLASGAGLSSDAIQFRIDPVRGSTTTLSPDLLALVTSYMLKKTDANNKAWSINIILDGEPDNTSVKEQYTNIWAALKAGTLVPLIFRSDATNETHYVQLFLTGSSIPTGDHWGGEMSLQCVEI